MFFIEKNNSFSIRRVQLLEGAGAERDELDALRVCSDTDPREREGFLIEQRPFSSGNHLREVVRFEAVNESNTFQLERITIRKLL